MFLSIPPTLFLAILVLILAVFVGNLPVWNPISVPSRCKIVSSSVDLRSSLVCELGLINYKAKHVFYSFDRKKFRCRHDYYWASVFKVEYVDHSGEQRLALAEAPKEALPLNCRPDFGTAWLTKDKFKINESYDCWYTIGVSNVDLYQDGLFNCQAQDPSSMEMLKRYCFLFMSVLKYLLSDGGSITHWRWDVVAGLVAGVFTTLLSFCIARLLHQLKLQFSAVRMSIRSPKAIRFNRFCLMIAYFSFMGWLFLQYMKWFGLPIGYIR